MSCEPTIEELLAYEAKLNQRIFLNYPCIGVCQYDRAVFDPEIIKGAMMTHPFLIRGRRIYQNFYYIPAGEFLGQKRGDSEVERWLENLDRERESLTEAALRESQRVLSTLMSNLPGMAYRCANDRDWTMEYISEGCLEITGYHPEDLVRNKVISYGQSIRPEDRMQVWNEIQAALKTCNLSSIVKASTR